MRAALARGLYFALQRLRGEPVAGALADVRASERLPLEQLLELQARRQLEQLRFAIAEVPYYRRTLAPLAGAIAAARDRRGVAEIMAQAPVVEKLSVLSDPGAFTAWSASSLPTHLDKTSGSSGTPVVFPCDQRAWAYRHALVYRCMEAFGVAIGEPYALFFGLHWNKQTRMQVAVRDRVFNRVRISAYEVAREQQDRHLRAIERHRPTHFQGYPSAIYDFCTLVRERGHDLRHLRLKGIFLTAEPLRPHQRQVIEEVTGSRCVDMYGSAEGGVLALECPAGGLHTTPEVTWLELRDTETHTGEAIVTDMLLRAFPMIRYAMGDEIVLRGGVCACGREQPLLASVEGRSGEPITLPNGRRINANLPSYIFKPLSTLGVIRRYRFVDRGVAPLELQLVVSAGFASEHLRIVERETRAAFGEDIPLRIEVVEALPHLANAKHRDYVRLA